MRSSSEEQRIEMIKYPGGWIEWYVIISKSDEKRSFSSVEKMENVFMEDS